jgi:hippurate hydrolase
MHLKFTLLALVAALVQPVRAEEPAKWAKAHSDELVQLYHHFHQHPELSFQEKETAARVAEEWKAAGFDVTTGVGGTGVVAILKNGPGPTLMLRTDLDALPVTEATNLVYASKVKVKQPDGTETGVMHACGHDIHITNLIGVARYLAANKDRWSGTLMLIGQPAEEVGNGAQKMLADGLFERFPKPDYAVALHVDSSLPTGKVGYRAGYAQANVDSVDITLHGRGGHGAAPHTTIDPIVMAAKLVLDLQTLISRETNPIEPAVVTVGSIHAGTKHNVIADDCKLQLTVRSYSDKVREHLLKGIERKAKAVAASAGAPEPEVTVLGDFTPSVFNDEKLVERLVPVWKKLLGADNVVQKDPTMGGEDFSFYQKAGAAVLMFRLGSVEPKRLAGLTRGGMEPPSLHSAIYYPDADLALETGVAAMAAAVIELLPPTAKAK